MKSMTGFASAAKDINDLSATVEIKGYNNRFLEIYLTMPPQFAAFEAEIRRLVSEYCRRGKVEINLRIKEKNYIPVSINHNVVKAYIKLCEDIIKGAKTRLSIKKKIDVIDLLNLDGVIEIDRTIIINNEKWHNIKSLIIEALTHFNKEREREGSHTEQNILSFIEIIETSLKQIEVYVPQIETIIKENIRKRFDELAIEGIDQNRVLAETALLLMKYTIAEEVSRLNGHLTEFRMDARHSEAPGKKLDFLSQEIGREINTIGSKTPLLEVSKLVVVMKEAVENIREQLRNVE